MNGYTRKVMIRLFMFGAGLFILIAYGAWQLALAVTRRQIYHARLVQMAATDPFTGLANRKLFFRQIGGMHRSCNQTWEKAWPVVHIVFIL
jgi:PleD family two-component response regulator